MRLAGTPTVVADVYAVGLIVLLKPCALILAWLVPACRPLFGGKKVDPALVFSYVRAHLPGFVLNQPDRRLPPQPSLGRLGKLISLPCRETIR